MIISPMLSAQCQLNQEIIDICQSDPEWKYSPAIYPVCAGSTNPDGTESNGLTFSQVDWNFEQHLTVVLPDSIAYQGFNLDFEYAILNNPNNLGLPEGFSLTAEDAVDWTLEDNRAYCLEISGPSSVKGVYPISLDMQFCAKIGGVPICVDTIVNCYELSIFGVANENIWSESGAVSIAPNPINNTGRFMVQASKSSSTSFNLYDVNGHLLRQEIWSLRKGENQLSFKREDLPMGLYFYEIEGLESGQLMIVD